MSSDRDERTNERTSEAENEIPPHEVVGGGRKEPQETFFFLLLTFISFYSDSPQINKDTHTHDVLLAAPPYPPSSQAAITQDPVGSEDEDRGGGCGCFVLYGV